MYRCAVWPISVWLWLPFISDRKLISCQIRHVLSFLYWVPVFQNRVSQSVSQCLVPWCGSPYNRPWRRKGEEGVQLNSGVRWSAWLAPRLGRFTPAKETRYQLYMRLGRPEDRSGRVRRMLPRRDSIPGPSWPYSRYTDYSIPGLPRCSNPQKYVKYWPK